MAYKYIPSVKRNIVLVKLWLTILGLSAIAVMVISMAIFYVFRDNTIQDIEASDRMMLTNVGTMLSNTIDTTENTIINTYKNPSVKRLIYENSGEWNDTMIATVNNTLSTLSTYSFLNSIYILRESDILYKASNKGIPEEHEPSLKQIVRSERPGKPIPWTYRANSGEATHLLSIFIGEKSNKSDGYESVAIGNVDMDMIHRSIFPNAFGDDQEMFVLNKDGTVILHNDMDQFDSDASSKTYIRKILNSEADSDYFTMNDKGKKYNVGYMYSPKGNYYIVHKIEYGLSVAKLTEARNTTLRYCLLVLLFVLVASLYLSYRIYRPINTIFSNIRGLFADVPQVSAPTDELQAMANATAKIIENMNNYDKHIENKAAIDLFNLSRNAIKPDEVEEILRKMKLQTLIGQDYAIVVLRISNFKPFEEHNTLQAIEYQLRSVGELASEGLSVQATSYAYPINNEHAVLIVTDGDKKLGDIALQASVEGACETIFQVLGLEIAAGISSVCNDSARMTQLYKEAFQFTNYRLIFGRRSVIDGETIRTETKNDELAACYMAAIEAVKKMSASDFDKALDRLFAVCVRFPYEGIMKVCTELAIAIARIPREIGGKGATDKEPDYHAIYVQFERFEDFADIRHQFKALYEDASLILSDLNGSNVSAIVSKAIHYLADHYNDPDLSANELADKLAITPSYFSKIFKEYTNATFPEYIAHMRLEKAKEMLLAHPNVEILEIGSKVGYNNASYFAAAFKKKYGITPSKYRANSLEME
ncbi:AraC family transcriptional regulator [Cohnella soli]|uniref:AraC family transcriptional regulator n=1 Tax=Cohnella soli TaxID=425005 RepID=A0ABW0HTS9_9BACL